MVAVGQHRQHGLVPVLADAHLVHLAVGDEADLVGRLAGLHDHLARLELLLDEPSRQGGEHRLVVEVSQQRQLTELLRDDPHLGPRGDKRHPPVAHRIGKPAVHPVHATRDLHPRQDPKQPP